MRKNKREVRAYSREDHNLKPQTMYTHNMTKLQPQQYHQQQDAAQLDDIDQLIYDWSQYPEEKDCQRTISCTHDEFLTRERFYSPYQHPATPMHHAQYYPDTCISPHTFAHADYAIEQEFQAEYDSAQYDSVQYDSGYCGDPQEYLMDLLREPNFIPHEECPFCSSSSKSAPTRNNYIKHAREKHPQEFAYCQFSRIQNGELAIPADVENGDYLLDVMTFIADKEAAVPSACFFPGCDRRGRDRNIVAGHFRGAHRRTYTYCQKVLNHVDRQDLDCELSKQDFNYLTDECKTRRKYMYKPGEHSHSSQPRSQRKQQQGGGYHFHDEHDDSTSDEAGSVYSGEMDYFQGQQQESWMYSGEQSQQLWQQRSSGRYY